MAYGLHPNAEVNFMTNQANELFTAIGNMAGGGGGGDGGPSLSERVKQMIDDLLEKLPELFNMVEIYERIDDVTPYTGVFLQEIERMNALIFEIRRSLIELNSGLAGDLSITEPMEIMMNAMGAQKQPPKWEKLAWASRAALGLWLTDMFARYNQLLMWTGDLAQPKVSWISGFFNSQAFVTAIMQVASRKNDWALDKLITTVDVTKKMNPEEIEGTSRDGAYVHGVFMEGARWDLAAGCMEDAFMKELYPKMPVILMRAILAEKEDVRGIYRCPVYKQTERATPGYHTPGTGYLFAMQLKTKQPADKWVMAGVAMLCALD